MTVSELAALEQATGPLDRQHRAFLTEVAGSGAGPGYGLLRPKRVADVIPLAHAGCAVTWLLRLDDGHRGEVWLDAAGSDQTYTPVASSFLTWYLGWVESAVRSTTPWTPWDTNCCATVSMLARFMAANPGLKDLSGRFARHAISLIGGGRYLPAGSALDPCHACVALVSRLGLTDGVFAPGTLTVGDANAGP